MAAFASLLVILAGVGTVAASQNSLPGEVLYPLKLTTEKIRIAVAVTPQARSEIRTSISQRRLEEAAKVLEEDSKRIEPEDKTEVLREVTSGFNSQMLSLLEESKKLHESEDKPATSESEAKLKVLVGVYKNLLEHESERRSGRVDDSELHKMIDSVDSIQGKVEDEVRSNRERQKGKREKETLENSINDSRDRFAEVENLIRGKKDEVPEPLFVRSAEELDKAKEQLNSAVERFRKDELANISEAVRESRKSAAEIEAVVQVASRINHYIEKRTEKDFAKIIGKDFSKIFDINNSSSVRLQSDRENRGKGREWWKEDNKLNGGEEDKNFSQDQGNREEDK
jgi:RNA polymerase-interacting CarD/CdnL/TRCF family regulator